MKELNDLKELDLEKTSIIKFSADWCGSCREVQCKLDELCGLFPTLDFWTLDVDKHVEIADAYKVNELPVIIAFKKGKAISRWDESIGADLEDWLKFLVMY